MNAGSGAAIDFDGYPSATDPTVMIESPLRAASAELGITVGITVQVFRKLPPVLVLISERASGPRFD
jgi:NADH:ubiquinone oxidoreductase subunit K